MPARGNYMKMKIIAIGKTTQEFVLQGIEFYLKRIRPYIKLEYQELRTSTSRSLSASEIQKLESRLLLDALKSDETLILLDEKGHNFSSVSFSQYLQHLMQSQHKTLVFAIGGAYGFSDDVKRTAHSIVSLSSMTFPHELVRLLLLEQIYRALTILQNHPYHH